MKVWSSLKFNVNAVKGYIIRYYNGHRSNIWKIIIKFSFFIFLCVDYIVVTCANDWQEAADCTLFDGWTVKNNSNL